MLRVSVQVRTQDPNSGNEATELRITMQLTHIMRALKDPSPTVRQTAVSGACLLLSTLWELLPARSITQLTVLLQACAFDAAAPSVRVALLLGIADLVNNPMVRSPVQPCVAMQCIET